MLCSHSMLTALQSLHATQHVGYLSTVAFAVTAECVHWVYKHIVCWVQRSYVNLLCLQLLLNVYIGLTICFVSALVCLMMKKKSSLHTLCLESVSPCILKGASPLLRSTGCTLWCVQLCSVPHHGCSSQQTCVLSRVHRFCMWSKTKEKERLDYMFRHQVHEEPSIIPGCLRSKTLSTVLSFVAMLLQGSGDSSCRTQMTLTDGRNRSPLFLFPRKVWD